MAKIINTYAAQFSQYEIRLFARKAQGWTPAYAWIDFRGSVNPLAQ
jgi:hypothetical protein